MNKSLFILVILFLAFTLSYGAGIGGIGDTKITNTMAASGASSSVSGSIVGFDMTKYKTATGGVIVNPSEVVARGYGLVDSCWIWAYTGLFGDQILVDSVFKAGLPCTLFFAASNDTLFKSDLQIIIQIADSSADSAFTAEHLVRYDIITRD